LKLQIEFKPTLAEIEDDMLKLFDKILEISKSLPRLERRLFAEWEGKQGNIEVNRPPTTIFLFITNIW